MGTRVSQWTEMPSEVLKMCKFLRRNPLFTLHFTRGVIHLWFKIINSPIQVRCAFEQSLGESAELVQICYMLFTVFFDDFLELMSGPL